MKSNSLAPVQHHGEILSIQNVADCRILASRYRPNLVVPSHIHDRACIGFIVDGQCEETFSNHVMDLRQHELFFRPAGEVHVDKSGCAGFRCLIAEVSDGWLQHIRDYTVVPSEPICVKNANLSWLSMRLHTECGLGEYASPLVMEGLMLEIAAGLVGHRRVNPRGPGPIWLQSAREALHAKFHEPLRLSAVANWVGIHPVHLAREFRKHHRCTVGQYVRKLRVESASQKLAESDSPLVAIALEVGFANQAHFCRIFKIVTGMTPARYRSGSRLANPGQNASIMKGALAPQR